MQLKGTAASDGIALGRALVVREAIWRPEAVEHTPSGVSDRLEMFDRAVNQACRELAELQHRLIADGRDSDADIIKVQLLLLKDEDLVGTARDLIERQFYTPLAAIEQTTNDVTRALQQLEHSSGRQKVADVRDLVQRIICGLRGEKRVLNGMEEGERYILVCDELSPSDAAQLNAASIVGVASASGGAMSHAAIIARANGIPVVVGIGESLFGIREGQQLLLHGGRGSLWIDPDERLLVEHRPSDAVPTATLPDAEDGPPAGNSAAGQRFVLLSNIGSAAEAYGARARGADGIGLFRTEFLFMNRHDFPTEEEQFAAYRSAAAAFDSGAAVTIRTMDVGGDKYLHSLNMSREAHSFLGIRGIRVSLDRQDLFRTQLRAILRASCFGNIKLLFPMISTVEEWKRAVALLDDVKRELEEMSIPFNRGIEVGVMIEVPAAAIMADCLAEYVDFFSIGTNDLIQYTMASSRTSPSRNELNDPLQPAVLRLIERVIRHARRKRKQVSLCGEMAGHPLAVPLLCGLGLNEFSVSPEALASVRRLLNHCDRGSLQEIAFAAINLDDAMDVRRYLEAKLEVIRN